jgi:hypothetical protein
MLKNHPGAVCSDWAHFTPAGDLLAIGLGAGLWAENARRRLENPVARLWSASCFNAKESFIVQTVDRKDLSANRGRSFQVADLVVCQDVSPS